MIPALHTSFGKSVMELGRLSCFADPGLLLLVEAADWIPEPVKLRFKSSNACFPRAAITLWKACYILLYPKVCNDSLVFLLLKENYIILVNISKQWFHVAKYKIFNSLTEWLNFFAWPTNMENCHVTLCWNLSETNEKSKLSNKTVIFISIF